jgi:sRNA-binding carbon storage regulator CsrA
MIGDDVEITIVDIRGDNVQHEKSDKKRGG